MRLIGDRLLVLLPPSEQTTESGLILAPALTPVTTHGRVFKVGPKVTDVRPGDMVAFPPEAGTLVELEGHACIFLRESEVTATVPKREGISA